LHLGLIDPGDLWLGLHVARRRLPLQPVRYRSTFSHFSMDRSRADFKKPMDDIMGWPEQRGSGCSFVAKHLECPFQ
jgi:hypothetical protein